jgi:ABC-type uncharacterized transport system permease subunit
MNDNFLFVLLTLDGTLRVSTPLILCAMAGLFSERSGIINIALEGKMLGGAFIAASAAFVSGSVWIGLIAAMGWTVFLALIHGFACITHRGDQVISGVAINILMSGLTIVMGIAWFSQGGRTPTLPDGARFRPITLPFADILDSVPIIGQFYAQVISGHNLLVYVAFLSVPLTWWVLYRTRFGLRLRAVGENPNAVDTAGISVVRMRYAAMVICGLLTGLAGAYLSIAQNAGFVREMSAGQGYIALAAMIFGKWRPFTAMLACLMFGLLDAIAIRLQGVIVPGIGEVPVQLIQALPYILTVVLLAGFVGKAIAPKAIGQPYIKER